MKPKIKLRRREQIQAAHDTLALALSGEVPQPFDKVGMMQAGAALDVLCWLLLHQTHGKTFAKNLKWLEKYVEDCGFALPGKGVVRNIIPGPESIQ